MSSTRRTCGEGRTVSDPGKRSASRISAWIAAESKKVTPCRSSVTEAAPPSAAARNIWFAVDMSTSPATTTVTRSPATDVVAEKMLSGPS